MNFAPPRPLEFDADEQESIAAMVLDMYNDGITARTEWDENHQVYDQMFRGRMEARKGPWAGSADLHVQAPYWLVDSINVRTVSTVWTQIPLVSGHAEEDDDVEKAQRAARLVEWHLSPKRMDGRSSWNRASKIRHVHGVSATMISYVTDVMKVRVSEDLGGASFAYNPDGSVQLDDNGVPIEVPNTFEATQDIPYYQGPVMTPLDWDDVVVPIGSMNLQPNRASNPKGADWVIVRQWERMSLMFKKGRGGFGGTPAYSYIFDDSDREEKDWWIGKQPSQDRSGYGRTNNQQRVRQEDRQEGVNRSQASHVSNQFNPEFEVLTYFGTYEVDGEDQEVVFFVCAKPRIFLGGFILSDYYWRGERPLMEMHYQTVGTRYYSMGVMEIVKHLSAELDTIHNMRLDVGFATNMPWFFYRAASGFDPDEIELRPLKGVPVDDPADVRFPQVQNVTSFYYQEEQLLFTLIERVMGVTDLFMGVSPTKGAAARHATGFVGAQQEAEARMSEIINQDARSFSFMCRTIYNLEMQYGPPFRRIRLEGEGREPVTMGLNKNDLFMWTDYDFSLGANYGTFSNHQKQQQAQALLQLRGASPNIQADPRRSWEVDKFYLDAISIGNAERFIGPADAVPSTTPKTPEEENGQMDQYAFGNGVPAPVSPNDNDDEHVQKHIAYVNSDIYRAMGSPNLEGHMAHVQLHARQKQQKQMMMMQQSQGAGQPQSANPMNRASAQIAPMFSNSQNGTALDEDVSIPEPPR